MASESKVPLEVLVIGAGVSGLACAQRLKRKDTHGILRVRVVEARDRLGGRVWTRRLGPASGVPSAGSAPVVDLGASWIHGAKNNPLTKMAREAGMVLGGVEDQGDLDSWTVWDHTGQDITDAAEVSTMVYDKIWDKAEKYAKGLRRSKQRSGKKRGKQKDEFKLGPRANVEEYLTAAWEQASQKGRLQRMPTDLRDDLRSLHLQTSSNAFAQRVDRLSLYWMGQEADEHGGDRLVVNGYSHLVDHLSDGVDVTTSCPVASIRAVEGSTSVVARDGRTFAADYVVVTLPVGVLKAQDVEFEPALPTKKTAAIKRMGFGLLDKVG